MKQANNEVSVQVRNGYLYLNFPRSWARQLFGVEQKRLSLGLTNNKNNQLHARSIANQMNIDFVMGVFDQSLLKYGLQYNTIDLEAKSLLHLWDAWVDFKLSVGRIQQTTYKSSYKTYRKCLIECGHMSPEEILKWLTKNRSKSITNSLLSLLNKCVAWGEEKGIKIYNHNPFGEITKNFPSKRKSISGSLKSKYVDEDNDEKWQIKGRPQAYTLEEALIIINAFRTHKNKGPCHLADYVEFAFLTGARPSEILALNWEDISDDCCRIRFNKGFVLGEITDMKTQKSHRIFYIEPNSRLQNLLLKMKNQVSFCSNNPVFTKLKGARLEYTNAISFWYGRKSKDVFYPGIVMQLYKNKVIKYLRIYSTRHTFITAAINPPYSLPPHWVADMVGTSVEMIFKYYLAVDEVIAPNFFKQI